MRYSLGDDAELSSSFRHYRADSNEMMFDPCAQHAIEPGKSFAQLDCSPFRHFAQADSLFEIAAASGDGPLVNGDFLAFEQGGRCRDNAGIRSRYEMNCMRQFEPRKAVRPVFADCGAGEGDVLAHRCSG